MKTTIEIEDGLLMSAKQAAVQRRTTLRAIVEHALRREVSCSIAPSKEKRYTVNEHGMPLLKRRPGHTVKVTSEDVRRLMEETED